MSTHNHDHGHDHGDVFHSHAPAGKMKLAFFLTLIILIVEVLGGWLSHSLALLSDAGHVLTDIAALGHSWYAMRQSEKPAPEGMTFGYYRAGILAAFINGITIILISPFYFVGSVRAFFSIPNMSPQLGCLSVQAKVGDESLSRLRDAS